MPAEQIVDGEAEALVRKAIELALAGDTVALGLLLDRIVPPRRDRPVAFSLPALKSPADAVAAQAAVMAALADGDLTPSEAAEVSAPIVNVVKAIEATDIEERVRALEEQAAEPAR